MNYDRPTPLLVILDIDETLVYSTEQPLGIPADDRVGRYFTYYRPAVNTFLDYLFENHRVAVWTASGRAYATPLLSRLLGENLGRLEFFWTGERCTLVRDFEQHERVVVKRLRKVWRKGFDRERTVIIDNTPSTYRRNYGNAVPVPDFEGDMSDKIMVQLPRFIDMLARLQTVRHVEKRLWFRRSDWHA